jgi:F-type H+-transporting ATPase subunit a
VLPFSFTVTSHVIITSFYSFSIFFAINFIAIKRHGLSFFNIFLPKGVPFILSPLVIYIEIISYISRVFSLSIRLFANMMAGHALLSIFTSFIFNAIFTNGFSIMLSITGILLIFSIILIELIIAFLQVYVFSTLIALYIKDIHNVDHLFM